MDKDVYVTSNTITPGYRWDNTQYRVAIGTVGALAKLHIVSADDDIFRIDRLNSAGSGAAFNLTKGRGTPLAPLRTLLDDTLFSFNIRGWGAATDADPATSGNNSAVIRANASENHTSTAMGSRWGFFTTPTGATATVERMRIEHNGGVAFFSRTLAQLQALAPLNAGQMFYCSDCTVDGIVISTGTAAGAFGRISARTTAIQ